MIQRVLKCMVNGFKKIMSDSSFPEQIFSQDALEDLFLFDPII